MGLTAFPHGVSSFGIPQVGAGSFPYTTTGSVFFVHSSTGSDSPGRGTNPDEPFASIDYAVGRCTANKGDVIYAMPGHAETVSAAGGLDLDVAGISIIGLGSGSLRPTVNFTTATTADMDVDAANIYIENILFTGGIDALVFPIDINAADCTIVNCEYRDVTGQATDCISADANADRLKIKGWVHRGAAAAGADTAIHIVGGDGCEIDDFDIDGNFAVAAILNAGTAATNLKIGAKTAGYNLARNRNSADVIFSAVSTTTGFVNNIFSRLADNAANITEALVGADMQFGPNLPIVNLDGEQALQWNGTASTDA